MPRKAIGRRLPDWFGEVELAEVDRLKAMPRGRRAAAAWDFTPIYEAAIGADDGVRLAEDVLVDLLGRNPAMEVRALLVDVAREDATEFARSVQARGVYVRPAGRGLRSRARLAMIGIY